MKTRSIKAFSRRTLELIRHDDRGDVPGWVMITIMTAGLVVGIFSVFQSAIVDAVQTALSQVISSTGG